MPYEVLGDEVNVLQAIGSAKKGADGSTTTYEHKSVLYLKGDLIADDVVSPVVKDSYEAGDEHTRSILKKVSASQAKKSSTEDESKD